MYRIGLIGCGYMGQAHLRDCCSRENISIYAVCDSDMQKAEETAERYHAVRAYADAGKLIEDPLVDIVIIATYPSSHLALLKKMYFTGQACSV